MAGGAAQLALPQVTPNSQHAFWRPSLTTTSGPCAEARTVYQLAPSAFHRYKPRLRTPAVRASYFDASNLLVPVQSLTVDFLITTQRQSLSWITLVR